MISFVSIFVAYFSRKFQSEFLHNSRFLNSLWEARFVKYNVFPDLLATTNRIGLSEELYSSCLSEAAR